MLQLFLAVVFTSSILLAQPLGVELEWITKVAPSVEDANNIYTDALGFTYVTGSSGGDYATIKYDSNGTEIWCARYSGHGSDYATAIIADDSGNVFVTGSSQGDTTGMDFLTIKYNPAGTELWAARYDGPTHDNDRATAIAIDTFGNIYITGSSEDDYTTIKYLSDGTQVWVERYDGPGNARDWANDIDVDSSGNVYVTGGSDFTSDWEDYATIKYASDGSELWVARYSGPGHRDEGIALVVDEFGCCIVTGHTDSPDGPNNITTIKYNPEGTAVWMSVHDGAPDADDDPVDLALDALGNVYITGSSHIDGDHDYITLKIDSEGSTQWVMTYDGPGNGWDETSGIGIDFGNNVYVTGLSSTSSNSFVYTTIKYSSEGEEIWVTDIEVPLVGIHQGPTKLTLDYSGNLYLATSYVGPSGNSDYVTIMLDSTGMEQWRAFYDGPEYVSQSQYHNEATAIAVGDEGNIYVTGSCSIDPYNSDYYTIKYSSDGDKVWAAQYSGSGYQDDHAVKIEADGLGNVIVAGNTESMETGLDFTTVKYAGDGSEVWVATYASPEWDELCDMGLDAIGNVFVTGYGSGGSITIKYTPNGTLEWSAPHSFWNVALSVDELGNSYLTGTVSNNEVHTIKYSPSGVIVWEVIFISPGQGFSDAIAVAEDGSVYVGASIQFDPDSEPHDYSDFTIIKYDSSGLEEWVAVYDGLGDGDDWIEELAIDGDGNIVGTGYSYGTDSHQDITTIKYSPEGDELWVSRYDGPTQGPDRASDIAIDNLGNVYVTGTSADRMFDFVTIKYTSTGDEEWVIRYDSESTLWPMLTDVPNAIAVDAEHNVYVVGGGAGFVFINEFYSEFTTIKYTQTVVSLEDKAVLPTRLKLYQNHPNPFNPTTTISYDLPAQSDVNLIVYDMKGREVRTLLNQEKPAGHYEVQWNGMDRSGNPVSTGVYFCRLQAGATANGGVHYSKTIKMVLLR